MSLKRYYTQKTIVEYTKGDFSSPASFAFKSTFLGLIQAPSNSTVFNNQKDTSSIAGVLFCDINQSFDSKDIIQDGNTYYKISGMAGQEGKGVAGLTPKRGQHAEYNLIYLQEGFPSDWMAAYSFWVFGGGYYSTYSWAFKRKRIF